MADFQIGGTAYGGPLTQILQADEIEPGSAPSYELCKLIFSYHPLGKKMAESPIAMAQSQGRNITIANSPEEAVKKAFLDEWKNLHADDYIYRTATVARIYGLSSIAMLIKGQEPDSPVNWEKLHDAVISFNIFDPLNTAGSLVLNQNPNDMDFLKTTTITVQGKTYHRTKSCVLMNEMPVYLDYTSSAFGFVGRSVYQRAMFPLKSYIQTLQTDDMVSRKAGVLIVKMQQAGSIVDRLMERMAGLKRALLRQAMTENILQIGPSDEVETLNMQNLDGPYAISRKNILENIAVSADMPAKLLNAETFAVGFGEGTEDAKHLADYIQRIRNTLQPLYDFFDAIVQRRAWNPEFYKTIQATYPDAYSDVDYNQAFFQWQNDFTATWPSLLTEPDSEKIKVEEDKSKSLLAFAQTVIPWLDPESKAKTIEFLVDNFNEQKLIVTEPLQLNYEELTRYIVEAAQKAQEAAASISGGFGEGANAKAQLPGVAASKEETETEDGEGKSDSQPIQIHSIPTAIAAE